MADSQAIDSGTVCRSHVALSRLIPTKVTSTAHVDVLATLESQNKLLRLIVIAEAVAIVALSAAGTKYAYSVANVEPLVVRVAQDGTAEVAPYEVLRYRLGEPEAARALSEFCERHYGRMRATANIDRTRKLYFMAPEIGRPIYESERESVQKFLNDRSEPEVVIEVSNVAIEDLRTTPYRATVLFSKVFRLDGRELKRTSYVAKFNFIKVDRLSRDYIKVNPLGLLITSFSESENFGAAGL